MFDLLAPALGLAVGLAVGQTSLAAEAQQLVSPPRCRAWDLTPENDSTLADSNVDILVCTPGRLMDHVHDTPGFTLQHLRYLVSFCFLVPRLRAQGRRTNIVRDL